VKIENLRLEKSGNRSRVVARVKWEDCDRPERDVYFETDAEFAAGLSCNPNAFLLAAIIPAMRHRERRILVDGEVCPELREGLMEVMSWLKHWSGGKHKVIQIEAQSASQPPQGLPERAAFFFSGGIDSLATLRANRLNVPRTHPGSFKDGLLIFGLDVEKTDAFEHVLKYLSVVAADAGINLVPVYTNERHLDDDWGFWAYEFQGAALSAVAHVLNHRVTSVSIGATYDLENLGPWGSHPLLDCNFSSHELRVRHDGLRLSRLEKTRLLAGWDVALHHMRVCNKSDAYKADQLNCGKCEKCLRTMLALICLGALSRSRAFAVKDVSEQGAADIHIADEYVASCYPELIGPLRGAGREDLARGVEHALARYRGETGFYGPLKRLDRVYFGNGVRKIKRHLVSLRHVGLYLSNVWWLDAYVGG
jgi:hypothetical protein